MTAADKINILDNAIIRMNVYLSFGSSYSDHLFDCGKSLMNDAIDTLKEIDAPEHSIYSIQTVSFESCRRSVLGGHMVGEFEMLCANKCNAYKQSVNSIISILNQERTRLIKEQSDAEQKNDKLLAKWTLICSAVAAICAIISLLFTIFN